MYYENLSIKPTRSTDKTPTNLETLQEEEEV
jgi:hypothetical protein